MSTNELWMVHLSVRRWDDPVWWDDYLRAVESVLGNRLIKLDVNDPARRKADTTRGEGEFITQFKAKEDSRWLFGRFERSGVEMQIQHYKVTDSFGRLRANRISFYVPAEMVIGQSVCKLVDLFRLTNEKLSSFYGYADFMNVICAKKPSTPSLDISRELMGVFWLTYFGPHYCVFFGRARLRQLEQASDGPDDGITLRLAETPGQISDRMREILEKEVGGESFAGTEGPKAKGQYALTLESLSSDK